jgi:hypothetical protein
LKVASLISLFNISSISTCLYSHSSGCSTVSLVHLPPAHYPHRINWDSHASHVLWAQTPGWWVLGCVGGMLHSAALSRYHTLCTPPSIILPLCCARLPACQPACSARVAFLPKALPQKLYAIPCPLFGCTTPHLYYHTTHTPSSPTVADLFFRLAPLRTSHSHLTSHHITPLHSIHLPLLVAAHISVSNLTLRPSTTRHYVVVVYS